MTLEAQHTNGLCLFVTLTYTDKHLPKTASGLPTVRKDDVRQFIRQLRKNTGWDVRYFGVTEYGKSESARPHAHAALFINQPDPILRPWTPKGAHRQHLSDNRIRWSQYSAIEREVLRAWGCKGSIKVDEFNQHRAAYVAKYLSKQATDERSLRPDQEPEGFTMSPGLGRKAVPTMAAEIQRMGGTLLELQKPGILVDVGTWSIQYDRQPIGVHNPHHRDKKTYPVPAYIRDKLVAELGGQAPEFDKAAELEFQAQLRKLEHFTSREKRAEKFERITRRKLAEGGTL